MVIQLLGRERHNHTQGCSSVVKRPRGKVQWNLPLGFLCPAVEGVGWVKDEEFGGGEEDEMVFFLWR